MNVSILEFGAVPDGVTLNTCAIQSAVDAVEKAGGGRVTVPGGTFLCGSIFLKDFVELHLEAGAHLLASPDLSHYNEEDAYPENFGSEKEQWRGKHLLIAHHKKGVSITGLGTIDGNGRAFFEEPHRCKSFHFTWGYGIAKAKNKEMLRPGQLLSFIECQDVFLSDFTLVDSPCWSVFLHGCENVRIRSLLIQNDTCHANTDGIDIDTCRFVTVSDCIIRTGDDAITLRAAASRLLSGKRVCEHISISNCILSTSAVGVRIGVGDGEIRNATISNLVLERAGTAVEFLCAYKKRGCVSMSHITVHHLLGDQVSFPFRILQGNGARIRDITLSDCRIRAICASSFIAEDPGCLKHILMKDIHVQIIPSIYEWEERAAEEKGWFPLFFKGAEDVTMENFHVLIPEEKKEEWKGLVFAEACKNLGTIRCNFEV